MAGLSDILTRRAAGGALPIDYNGRPTLEEAQATNLGLAQGAHGDFGGGLAAAVRGNIGSSEDYAAAGLAALGADNAARSLRDAAARDNTYAAAYAPEINSLDKVVDPTTAARYAAGVLGGAAGSIPPAIIGGLAGRLALRSKLGALAGSTLAYEPSMAGQHIEALDANPNTAGMSPTEKFLRGTGVGTAESLVQGVAPGYMANRLLEHAPVAATLGGAAKNALKTVGIDSALQGAGSVGADVIGQAGMMQADPTQQFNPGQALEAGAAGAIGGAGIGMPHTALAHGLDYLAAGKSATADAAKKVADSDLFHEIPVPGAIDAVRGAAQNVADAGALFKNTAAGYLKHPELAKLVAAQERPPELEGASQGEIMDWLAKDDGQRHQAALNIAKRTLIDPEASDGEKQTAQALLDNPTDPQSWKPFADGVIAKQQIDRLGAKIGQAGSQLAGWVDKVRGKTKSNLELTPQDTEFTDAMREPLAKTLGTDDAPTLDRAASLLNDYVLSGFAADGKGDVRVPDGLVDALGDHAPKMIADAYDTLRRQGRTREFDDTAKERLAAVGKLVSDRLGDLGKAADIVQHQLTPTMYRQIPKSAWPDIADAARHYLRTGEKNDAVEADLDKMFGANKDVVLEQLAALDPKRPAPKYDANEGSADTRGMGEEDAGSDKAAADHESPVTELTDVPDYHFKGTDPNKPEAFDRADPFLAKNVQLAKDRMDTNVVSSKFNHDTGMDEPHTTEIGAAKHARESGDNTTLTALRQAHPGLSDKQLDERFFVLGTRNKPVDVESVNIKPSELKRPATRDGKPNKASWQDVTRMGTKEGNRDVSTIEHGRIYMTPGTPGETRYVDHATGEVFNAPGEGRAAEQVTAPTKQGKEFVTSAQKLIGKMWEKKGQGAFDERTAEKTGPADMLSMFSAGLASLHDTGKFHGEMQVKMPDGEMRVINGEKSLPNNFVLWDGKSGKVTVGDARKAAGEGIHSLKSQRVDKETGKYPGPKKLGETVDIADIPHMTRDELRAAGEATKAALENTKLSDGAREALQAKLDAFREAYDKRVTDGAPGERKEQAVETRTDITGKQTTIIDRDNKGNIFSKATAKSYAGENDRVVKQGDRWVVERDIGHKVEQKAEHLTETEEMSATKTEGERRFDELTGLELHPKSDDLPSARSLDRQVAGLREQYKTLDAKITEFEGKEGKNAVREANLRKWRAERDAVVEKGRALAARRDAKSSLEQPGNANITPEQKTEVESYVNKTLGPQVAKVFTDQLRGSGEWSRDPANQQATIKISTSALNPLSVAHHEAMHEFFQRLLDNGHEHTAETLRQAADSPLIKRQLERTFADQPEVLKQIEADPEERVAYMFQLWASDKLNIGTKTETVFRKIVNAMRKAIGLLSKEQKLEGILNAFHSGEMSEPSAMARALDTQEARGKWLRDVGAKVKPILARSNEWVGFAENALTDSGNPALDWIGRQLHNKTGKQGDEQGYLSAKEQANNQYMNKFAQALRGIDPTGKDKREASKEDVDLALQGLQEKTWHADPVVRRVQDQIVDTFKEMYGYMEGAGIKRFDEATKEWVPVRKVDDYRIPVSWDPAKIIQNSARFKSLLLEHHADELDAIAAKANGEVADGEHAGTYTASWAKAQNPDGKAVTAENIADALINRLIGSNGQADLQEKENALGFSPFAKAVNERSLSNWIDHKVFAEFQEKDITKIISSYVGQVTKRGEYSRRFGADGEILQQKMDEAWKHEAAKLMKEQPGLDPDAAKAQAVKNLEPARRAIMAMEGTLGSDISPTLRKASAYTTVYQNVRLLGYSMFSNLIDPMGILVRGGEVKDAYAAFKRGMRDVVREWGSLTGLREAKESDRDEATWVAEMIGTVDSAGFMSQMGTMFGSQYLPEGIKRMNDDFFRWNGTEALNRAMRIQATQAAIGFIKRHYEKPNEHSDRYFKELGLSRDDVNIADDGALNVANPKVQQAVMRWVDGAVLRPNAAMRPTMASDPHYAVFYHLKQFMYAMHSVILKRAQVEVKNGNTSPLMVLMAGYIPVMIAADAAKGLLQTALGGGAPVWEHDGVAGIMSHGAQRAGLLGIGQIPVDAINYGPAGLLGPTAEQAVHAATEPLSQTLSTAAAVGPANMLLKGANWDQ